MLYMKVFVFWHLITLSLPIDIKIKESAKLFQITKGYKSVEYQFDHDTEIKHWLHPAISFTILVDIKDDDSVIQIYTDESKNEEGTGAGAAIYINGAHTRSLQYKLHEKCTNNQSEQLAILKSLEYIQNSDMTVKKVTIYTDSQTSLESIKNIRIHTSLIDKIRLQTWK